MKGTRHRYKTKANWHAYCSTRHSMADGEKNEQEGVNGTNTYVWIEISIEVRTHGGNCLPGVRASDVVRFHPSDGLWSFFVLYILSNQYVRCAPLYRPKKSVRRHSIGTLERCTSQWIWEEALPQDLCLLSRSAIPIDWDRVSCNVFARRNRMFPYSFSIVLAESDQRFSRHHKYCFVSVLLDVSVQLYLFLDSPCRIPFLETRSRSLSHVKHDVCFTCYFLLPPFRNHNRKVLVQFLIRFRHLTKSAT